MTRIRGIISSIVWTSADITWEFCGRVLEIEEETEKKVLQEMARCQDYVAVNLLINLATNKPREFLELPKHDSNLLQILLILIRPKTVISNVMRNIVSNFSN